jgi:hypothetical protein
MMRSIMEDILIERRKPATSFEIEDDWVSECAEPETMGI